MFPFDLGNQAKLNESLMQDPSVQAKEEERQKKERQKMALFNNDAIREMLKSGLYPVNSHILLGVLISLAAVIILVKEYFMSSNYWMIQEFNMCCIYAGLYLMIQFMVLMTYVTQQPAFVRAIYFSNVIGTVLSPLYLVILLPSILGYCWESFTYKCINDEKTRLEQYLYGANFAICAFLIFACLKHNLLLKKALYTITDKQKKFDI